MDMKAVAFNCSPREDGNTAGFIATVMDVLRAEGIETETVQVGGRLLRGCQACGVCRERKDGLCKFDDDIVNSCIAKMEAADAIIIGSPTYFADVTAEAKALIDRAGFVSRSNGNMFSRKVGAGVAVHRRSGALNALDSITHFFTISDMFVAGSTYWSMGVGKAPGDHADDEEGMATMRRLGENIAWLLKRTGE